MDFTILAVVLLLGVGVPIRNKLIRKYRDKKKQGVSISFPVLILHLGQFCNNSFLYLR